MKRLEQLRNERHMTQERLGNKAHLDKSYISKAENYGNHLGAGQLARLAAALEWTGDPEDLMLDVECDAATCEQAM